MANYLIRRSGRYSYRRRYPIEVAQVIGRTEFVQALGTADPKEAARLARAVAVAFDETCAAALRKALQKPSEAERPPVTETTHLSDQDVAKRVLDTLPGIMRTVTESVIAEQARNSQGWRDEVAWRRQGLLAQIDGMMPKSIQIHPLVARAALQALDAAAEGKPLKFDEPLVETGSLGASSKAESVANGDQMLTTEALQVALEEYAFDKSNRRKQVARRCAERTLTTPCSQQDASIGIALWCTSELARAKKPVSVWTEASAVISLLKFVAGWHNFDVPKVGSLRSLRGVGRANKEARAPMPVQSRIFQ